MRTELIYTITEEDKGTTVRSFLEKRGYSHNLLRDLKQQADCFTIDGIPVPSGRALHTGESLRIKLPREKSDTWITPEEMPLAVVYEDDDLLVIDKDPGVLVHPTPKHPDGTLANGLRWYFDQKGESFTFRVVNRLDQDTSGLLIIPRHTLSAGILGRALKEREIYREYLAAAAGDVRKVFPDGEGVIDAPIAVSPGQSLLREVDFKNGEKARTHLRVLAYNENLNISLCAVTLDTGRTHQIRVHFQYIGHPLLGDFLYNPDYRLIARQSLHSYRLSFVHPVTREPLTFTAPLPDDMRKFIPG